MKTKEKTDFLLPPAFWGLLFIIYSVVWAGLYLDLPINTDFGWLLTCLERFMAGGTYTRDFYETNPPLSFLIYLPAYPLYRTVIDNPGAIILLNTALYIGVSTVLLWRFMKLHNYATPLIYGVFSAFLLANTWILGSSFGQKDQVVLVFLLPYAMLQVSLLAEKAVPGTLRIPSALLGGLAVCIKPHYIVVPALFITARYFFNRSLPKLIKSPDIIIFVLTGLAYLAFLRIAFPDFMETILPQVADLYSADEPFPVTARLPLALYTGAAIFLALFLAESEGTRRLKITLYTLIGLSLLCILPYYAQNKGLMYHAIPFYALGVMAFMVALFGLLYQAAKNAEIAILAPFILVLLLTFILPYRGMIGYPPGFLSKEEFKNIPYHRTIKEKAWNGIYLDLDLKPFNLALPHYEKNLKQASRFGQIWPLIGINGLYSQARTEKDRKEISARMDGFIDLIVEDIKRYEPSVILIPRYRVDGIGSDEPQKKYYERLLKNKNFATAMKDYELVQTLSFDKGLYDRGTNAKHKEIPFTTDIFIRKKDNGANSSESPLSPEEGKQLKPQETDHE